MQNTGDRIQTTDSRSQTEELGKNPVHAVILSGQWKNKPNLPAFGRKLEVLNPKSETRIGLVFIGKTKPISAVAASPAVNEKQRQKCSKVLKNAQKLRKSFKNSHKPSKTVSNIRISAVPFEKTDPMPAFRAPAGSPAPARYAEASAVTSGRKA